MKVKKNLVYRLNIAKDLNASKILKINPKDIIISEWVRMKCLYGCPDLNKSLSCPPFSTDLEFTRNFLNGYNSGLLIQWDLNISDEEERWDWSRQTNVKLLNLEREIFLKGNYKTWAFSLGCCKICNDCLCDPDKCPSPESRRGSPESFGIDVFGTARKYGIKLEVKRDEKEPFKYVTFVLIK
jgi:predicted metal-binding protein